MLQQTQVETVIPYYHRFLLKFPDVGVLAKTRLHKVLKVWENLGYYSRARHIHEAAKEIVERYNGRIPDSMEELRRLPGIGPYIAAAILCFAFGRQIPTVEAYVKRPVASVKHAYTHFRTTLHGFHCRRVGEPETLGCYRWEWAAMPELGNFPFSKVDRKIMEVMNAMS